MKKIILFSSVLALLAGCGGSSNGNMISGKIEGAEGKSIYLERFVNDRPVKTDSTTIGADGSFGINPSQGLELNFYRLIIDNDHYTVLITDSSESPEVSATFENMKLGASFSGSKHSETLSEFYKLMEPYAKQLNEFRIQAQNPSSTPEVIAQLKSQYQSVMMEKNQKCKDWLGSNNTSPASLAALNELDIRTDLEAFKQVRDGVKESFGHSFYFKEVAKRIDAITAQGQNGPKPGAPQVAPQPGDPSAPQQVQTKSQGPISVGMMAPELAAKDPNGKTIKLSDFKGKVVLIDFWASWCGPCRKENPAVVAAYNQYHSKGFEVLSVSLDNNLDKWKQAIATDGLIWKTHISDLKGWQSELAAAYGVHSIPCPVLVGKDGKIINFGQNIRGPFLEQELVKLFGK